MLAHNDTSTAFAVHTIGNHAVSCTLAPELGARVVSLRDRVTGREWLDGWAPEASRRLWKPTDPGDYATGPGAGLDECLPTVLPCEVMGRPLGDHGELWNRPVPVHLGADGTSATTSWNLRSLPLGFMRVVSVVGNRVHFDYRLENLADVPTPFQWAWHPLFTLEAGDELRIAGEPDTCLAPGGQPLPWPEAAPGCDLARADLAGAASRCAKVFVGPLVEPGATIRTRTGAGLALTWRAEWLPYAGIWITRGGWKGLHHWAVEPTNAPVDRLSDVVDDTRLRRLVWLEAREVRQWRITASLHSACALR